MMVVRGARYDVTPRFDIEAFLQAAILFQVQVLVDEPERAR